MRNDMYQRGERYASKGRKICIKGEKDMHQVLKIK